MVPFAISDRSLGMGGCESIFWTVISLTGKLVATRYGPEGAPRGSTTRGVLRNLRHHSNEDAWQAKRGADLQGLP